MKKLLFMVIVTGLILPLLGVNVQMANGTYYSGYYEAKQGSNIYIVDWTTIYELPIKEVVTIIKGHNNVTEDYLTSVDFSRIDINSSKYQLVTYNQLEEIILSKEEIEMNLMNMSDREFTIYQMNQQQKQAKELNSKISGVSNTMWKIWAVSIGITVLSIFVISAE